MRGAPRRWTQEELREAVASCFSWSEVGQRLGVSRETVRRPGVELGLDTSHFRHGRKRLESPELARALDNRVQAVTRRREEFLASRGGVCEQCGEPPYAVVRLEGGGKPAGWVFALGEEYRRALLAEMTVLCQQCFLDSRYNGRPHGTLRRYAKGCRCEKCRKVRADYQKTKRAQKNGVSKRPRWKYDEPLTPTKKTARLWGVPQDEPPAPADGWWHELGRDTVDVPAVDVLWPSEEG